jgi:NADH-quinone oxidoreductase subunit G
MDRGHRSEINIYPGFELANPYSGNLADVCPVGALTDRDFRFKCRVWFLGSAPSICPGCSRGCNIEIHFNERFNPRYHDQRVHRLKPRFNEAVNGHWICDEGRYAYHAIDAPNRLRIPQLKQGEAYQEISWTRAMQEAAVSLKNALATYGPQGIAVLASPQLSNEELFLILLIFKDSLGIERIESRVPSGNTGYSDDFLITADKNPNTRGTHLLLPSGSGSKSLLQACAEGNIHYLYVFQHDLTLEYDPAYVMEAFGKVNCVVFQGSWNSATAALSDIQLPASVYAEKEGTFTNLEGRVQRFHPAVPPIGESLPDLEILARLAVELGVSLPGVAAAEVLAEIGKTVAAFAGVTWQTVGSSGQLLNSE